MKHTPEREELFRFICFENASHISNGLMDSLRKYPQIFTLRNLRKIKKQILKRIKEENPFLI